MPGPVWNEWMKNTGIGKNASKEGKQSGKTKEKKSARKKK
jgi:hypothetical protein